MNYSYFSLLLILLVPHLASDTPEHRRTRTHSTSKSRPFFFFRVTMFAVHHAALAALPGVARPISISRARGGNATLGKMQMASPVSLNNRGSESFSSSSGPSSRGATVRARAGPSSNDPNFDPNDPMTWNAPAVDQDEAAFASIADMGAPVDDLMQLDDSQLAQLLGAEGATVPVMLEDGGASPSAEAAAGDSGAADTFELPVTTAAEAIDKGLALYKAGDYPEALAAFTGALDLPGSGPIRRRKAMVKPAGPSQGFADADVSLNEQIAIHYNCACCHARLNDTQAGLVSLVRAMEAGYDDYENIRSDADIASLRADSRFEGIMAKFEPSGFVEGVFAMMQRGTTREQAKKGGAPKGGGGGELIGGLFDAVKSKMKK